MKAPLAIHLHGGVRDVQNHLLMLMKLMTDNHMITQINVAY